MKSKFQDITADTMRLLNKEEGIDVDFKTDGLDSEDIVAFANSKQGGVILIGVDEITDHLGQVRGKIVGTKIGDSEKLKIINKALDCSPPIQLNITYENTSDKPIIRVDIPSGQYRPYCTKKGIYKIRNDGRNQALTADQLFDIFLEREYKTFINKFKEATKELKDEITEMAERLEIADIKMSRTLEDISYDASQAETNSYDAQSTSESIYSRLQELEEKFFEIESLIEESTERELLILKHLGLPDPRVDRLKAAVKRFFESKMKEHKTSKRKPSRKKLIDEVELRIKGNRATLTRKEIEELYDLARS